MTFTDTQLLDLEIPIRQSTFRFELVDGEGNVSESNLGVVASSPPSIENNINRGIKRTLTGFRLPPNVEPDVNTLADTVRVYMVLQNASEYPLGTFAFTDASRGRRSHGLTLEGTLSDLMVDLQQPLPRNYQVLKNTSIRAAIFAVTDELGIEDVEVDATAERAGSTLVWSAGNTWLDVLNHLGDLAGFYSAYYSNAGVLTFRVVPDIATTTPTLEYESGGRLIDGSMVESNDLLAAPNRYIVVDSSGLDAPVSNFYDIPDSAPHSIANRGGRVVATTISMQGVATAEQALLIAKARASSDSSTYEWVDFVTPPDPRHDTYDLVTYLGNTYREQGWTMQLRDGPTMAHSLRRVYG